MLAIADISHGQHNGDIHRQYIHAPEFIFFTGFLIMLEILTFKTLCREIKDRWLVVSLLSFFSFLLSLLLFGLSGGSFHGDGGPIAASFLLIDTIAAPGIVVGLIGSLVTAIIRKNQE